MTSPASQQYAYRAQKSMGLINGTPNYEPVEGFQMPDVASKTYQYSSDGRLFVYALPSCVRIFKAEGALLLQELAIANVIELNFSPRGTYLSTWERSVKLEDGAQHKNLRIFSVSTGEELISFTQKSQEGWDVQYTISESHAVRLVGQEIQVFNPAEWSKGIVEKLKVEGAASVVLSPGLKPSVAVFIPERKGAPASVRIYSLLDLASPPTCQKTFFKAEKSQIKWNTFGTHVLVLTHTDVDNTNKSYYGQTGLYLLSAVGGFDCRVQLDKEGPVHDFAWSPNSREFGVVYGFMPAKAMLFDQHARSLHDFGSSFYNFIAFNSQSRLIALAGFGNLAGKVDIFDRRSLMKISTIDASNTSHCEWSPDGKFLLTATLSPRLRVDNGIKIWYALGQLVHIQPCDELYQASWRPLDVDHIPPLPPALPPAPMPASSVTEYANLIKPTPVKPAGAYRPPGARGQSASTAYKRDEEGGSPAGSGAATPTRPGRSPAPHANGRRFVPGAPPSPSPASDANGKNRKRKVGAKDRREPDMNQAPPELTASEHVNGAIEVTDPIPPTPGADGLDPVQKKIRNLNKKLKAIDELKERVQRGERLEMTQLKKIETEADIRKELAQLTATQ